MYNNNNNNNRCTQSNDSCLYLDDEALRRPQEVTSVNVGSDFGHVYSFLLAAERTPDEQTPTLTKVPTHTQLPRSIQGAIRPQSNMLPP